MTINLYMEMGGEKMTQKERETIQRAAGIIEGVSVAIKDELMQNMLACASDMLSDLLRKDGDKIGL